MTGQARFACLLVALSACGVFLLVCGVLFGPFEVDPQAPVLIALVAQPGGVALGWLMQRREP